MRKCRFNSGRRYYITYMSMQSRYNEVVLKTAREIFNSIKHCKTSYQKDIDLAEYHGIPKQGAKKDPRFILDLLMEIDLYIKYDTDIPWSHNISAQADQVKPSDAIAMIEGKITVNPNFLPVAYNDILAEIKEMLRHELEHITQGKTGKLQYQKYRQISYNKYLVLRHEIPAYMYGLYTRAKTKRMTVTQALEEWYTENKNNFDSPSDWPAVKQIWMDWGMQYLPNAKW